MAKVYFKTDIENLDNSLLVIHGKVYHISKEFLAFHPGGKVVLSQLGNDASTAFEAFHSKEAHEWLSEFYVGDLAAEDKEKSTAF